jgi:hypothetical protein
MYFELQPGSVISCKKGFATHLGLVLDRDLVLHNNPTKGEHLSSIAEFSGGQPVQFVRHIVLTPLRRIRIQEIITAPKQYALLTNNCEHTLNRVIEDRSSSPQILGVAVAALLFAVILS